MDSTELQQQLRTHQGFAPLLALDVDARAVATVVADWTGIPLSSLLRGRAERPAQYGKEP